MLPVEIYLLLAGLLHVAVATARTYKFKLLKMMKDAKLHKYIKCDFENNQFHPL